MDKERKEGEYPFYPKPAEHPVIRDIYVIEVTNEETLQQQWIQYFGPE